MPSRKISRRRSKYRRKSRSRVRISVKKGGLSGYTIADSLQKRREILKKISKKDGWSKVVKRLNVLYIYNKNNHPENAMKFRRDMFYVQKNLKI